MGNSIRSGSGGLLSNFGDGDDDYHLQLGRAFISLPKRRFKTKKDGGSSEKWTMTYYVDDSYCELELTRLLGNRGEAKGLILKLSATDGQSVFDFLIDIQAITEAGVQVCPGFPRISVTNIPIMLKNSQDGVRDVYLYGIEHKGGLIVVERRIQKGVDLPYALTVAHYYAISAGINGWSKPKTTDFGLSVVANIRACNGNLVVTVEGPEQHPACALIYMFNEVSRTVKWKPTMCPHCANIRRQRSIMYDSEDSDSVPVLQRRGSRQSARSIANDGNFKGHGNGGSIVCQNFNNF